MIKRIIVISIILLLLSTILLQAVACSKDTDATAELFTKFIAHRGLSSEHYDNSEDAFLAAADSSFFWGIETDIWQTKDGVWVCAHDINPFADINIKITDLNFAEASIIPLKPTQAFEGEYYLCSFQRYLEICSAYNKTAVIELKFKSDTAQLIELLEFTQNIISLDNTMFISFHSTNITKLLSLNSAVIAQILVNAEAMTPLYVANSYNIGISKAIINDDIIALCKEKGLLINVWTVNDKEEAAAYVVKKVNFITTDYIFDFTE
ncbi:MAG: hypothetical protein EOM87_02980 [Clostridia bacterium]|nr:hypothetical protein [Clostridia bacterium]